MSWSRAYIDQGNGQSNDGHVMMVKETIAWCQMIISQRYVAMQLPPLL
jgi:hypothetical protein